MVSEKPSGEGVVFDIQHFSVHDGPGIRTNVFLKGCPIRCRWCSNPESQQFRPQMTFEERLCIGCGECARRCPRGAVKVAAGGGAAVDLAVCVGCSGHECLAGCYARALKLAGEMMSVGRVMEEVLKDREFYGAAGGATFTGGEPFSQPEFLRALLSAAKDGGVTTAVETCLCVDWECIRPCTDLIDTFLCDIKHVDAEKLRKHTGAEWLLIESNLGRLSAAGRNLVARVPVVEGFNATVEEIAAIASFVSSLGVAEMHLLPYHAFGKAKYAKLNQHYLMEETAPPGRELMADLKASAEGFSLKVVFNG